MTFVMGPALLFCPADRPERFPKAAQRADAVIVDLEDAVAPADKQRARGAILAQLGAAGEGPELDPSRTIIRINPAGTDEFERDLHCLAHTPYRTVMLAKAESAAQLEALADYHVIALCETAVGVLNAPAIAAAPNVVALMWAPRTSWLPSAVRPAERTTAATAPWRCTHGPRCCSPPGLSGKKPWTPCTSTSRTLTGWLWRQPMPQRQDSAPRPASIPRRRP
ncbi:citrate lyase subunit beta-like protein [Arthrobacter sp. Hiyo4]|nr:citrate lyase subunit beta-like protein [Arthrobacter sp. Hiyo4]